MKQVAVFCGGESYEHEVSIITGIQVVEAIDQTEFRPLFVYFDKENHPFFIKGFSARKDFLQKKRVPVVFEKVGDEVFMIERGLFGKRHKLDCVYLGFHGGTGESGGVQGMLEILGVPFTSPSSEGSVIAMNKALTKQVLRANDISVLDSLIVNSAEYQFETATILTKIQAEFAFPVIIKPVHLGSSIGIEIAKNEIDLEKYLNVATRVDSEVLIEPALSDFTEYNASVRSSDSGLEVSPIEEPKREGDMLSFDDKYANGSKKTGGKSGKKIGGGMQLLDRTVPADISSELKKEITDTAKKVYRATRLAGLVRIDFMYHSDRLYCTEINPIPGSMSFYLWEPAGEQFTEQITKSLEDAQRRHSNKNTVVSYQTDIVSKFLAS